MVNETHPGESMYLRNFNQFCSFPCMCSELVVPEAFEEDDTCPCAPLGKMHVSETIFLLKSGKKIRHLLHSKAVPRPMRSEPPSRDRSCAGK